jgi:Homeodomain-like domain
MRQPIFVRALTEEERKLIEAGLRSSDAFVLRRSQILLASARRERVPSIARALSCDEQTVRNAIYGFNQRGPDALQASSPSEGVHNRTGSEKREHSYLSHGCGIQTSKRAIHVCTLVWTFQIRRQSQWALYVRAVCIVFTCMGCRTRRLPYRAMTNATTIHRTVA